MARAYSNVSWKSTSFETNLVFIRVFNFLRSKLAFQQATSHSCLPLPNFFVHVMVFCKVDWASFKETPSCIYELFFHLQHTSKPLTTHVQNMCHKRASQLKNITRHDNGQGRIQGGQILAFSLHTSQYLVGQLQFSQKRLHKPYQCNSTNICSSNNPIVTWQGTQS